MAVNCGESVYPLVAFIEWLERVPEAREMLAQYGLGWGVGEAVKREVTEDVPSGGDVVFRARIGERWQNVKLLDVVGSVIKVRVIGAPVGHMTTISVGQISPVDLKRVQQAIAEHPGSKTETFFDEDEGVTRSVEGRPLMAPPLPPPTGDTMG